MALNNAAFQSEFQILSGTESHVQKVLNQWRHQYFLTIHGFQMVGEHCVVFLQRELAEYEGEEE